MLYCSVLDCSVLGGLRAVLHQKRAGIPGVKMVIPGVESAKFFVIIIEVVGEG
jgi:hypothetical protein